LVEAQNQSAQEYGEGPLFAALNSGANLTPEIMLQQIISGVNDFVGQTPQHDDITCMLIKAT
jgi:serine phosphatase RsbU (regulator of sigma subunit)